MPVASQRPLTIILAVQHASSNANSIQATSTAAEKVKAADSTRTNSQGPSYLPQTPSILTLFIDKYDLIIKYFIKAWPSQRNIPYSGRREQFTCILVLTKLFYALLIL